MRYSKLFGKTTKDAPHDADSANARLLTQGGFGSQLTAGVYTYLPLGHRVLTKIKAIVRDEMNALGAQEVLMPALHPKHVYEATGRWDTIDVMFKVDGAGGKEYGLSSTAEEVITPLVKEHVRSYRDFPVALYQIQDKFRKEPRAKSGLLRGREFSKKNLYSFLVNKKRLPGLDKIQMKMPFMGKWKVTQGIEGTHTHKDVWKYAWDFIIEENVFCNELRFIIKRFLSQNHDYLTKVKELEDTLSK